MTDNNLYKCRRCGEMKDREQDYYILWGKYRNTLCKPCCTIERKLFRDRKPKQPKKRVPTGFEKLHIATREAIVQDLQNKVVHRVICEKYGILYNTFRTWMSKKQVHL